MMCVALGQVHRTDAILGAQYDQAEILRPRKLVDGPLAPDDVTEDPGKRDGKLIECFGDEFGQDVILQEEIDRGIRVRI